MSETERQDRIDRYVRGEMGQAERDDFLKEMEADSSLAEDVMLTQDISRQLGALEKKKQMMQQWEKELREGQDGTVAGDGGSTTVWRTLYAVAGIAACLLVGFFFWNKGEDTQTLVRGNASVEQISKMIDEGKYEEALVAIDEILADTIIDKSLPEDEQEYMRAEQALNREKLLPLREKAVEKSNK